MILLVSFGYKVNWLLIQHSKYVNTKYLSGAWLGGDPRVDTKKTCLKEIGLYVQTL